MTLLYIVGATLAGGLLSVLISAALTVSLLARLVKNLVSLSTGVLLGTALLQVLPEAFESKADAHGLFLALLGGLLFFFLLEKAELYRHDHHHEGDDPHHGHAHGFDAEQAGRGGWSVLVGDSIHNFCDGVIIAAAFLTSPQLGIVTALAIVAHEIPQEVGDIAILLHSGYSRRRALILNIASGAAGIAGALVGYSMVSVLPHIRPFVLAFSSASMLYIAMSDLIPDLHRGSVDRNSLRQVLLIAAGIGTVVVLEQFARH